MVGRWISGFSLSLFLLVEDLEHYDNRSRVEQLRKQLSKCFNLQTNVGADVYQILILEIIKSCCGSVKEVTSGRQHLNTLRKDTGVSIVQEEVKQF